MITRTDLNERVREWGLREDVVEKDYALGWALWGIGSHPRLAESWAFKGGTCLKKCYVETYRFSEDLDFTVLPDGPVEASQVVPILKEVFERVYEESGIDFREREPRVRMRPDGRSAEGRIYYRGPRNAPQAASIRLDLTIAEQVARPTILRLIAHPYPDTFPGLGTVRCYDFEELFAEKLRAMGERCRPRDLYDIITLFRRSDLLPSAGLMQSVYTEKCESKGVAVFTCEMIQASPFRVELEDEWANMLAHQLPALPPFGHLWAELMPLFDWLEGRSSPSLLTPIPVGEDIDAAWSPSATIGVWKQGIPLEMVRFAAANHLCVELGDQDAPQLVEPYTLKRNLSGQIVLYAVEFDSDEVRPYLINEIQDIRVTSLPFSPRFAIEVTGSAVSL